MKKKTGVITENNMMNTYGSEGPIFTKLSLEKDLT